MNEDRLKKDPVEKKEVCITDKGTTLCYDVLSGRYFNSDREFIKRAENEINRMINLDMYASLNDFYDVLGLEHVKLGDQLGWNLDKGLLEIDFDTKMATNGQPCLVIDYNVAPDYGFNRFL